MTGYDCGYEGIVNLGAQLASMKDLFRRDVPPTLYLPYGELTAHKAREILHDGTVHGHPITDRQRRYFGWVSGGSQTNNAAYPTDYAILDQDGFPVPWHAGGKPVTTLGLAPPDAEVPWTPQYEENRGLSNEDMMNSLPQMGTGKYPVAGPVGSMSGGVRVMPPGYPNSGQMTPEYIRKMLASYIPRITRASRYGLGRSGEPTQLYLEHEQPPQQPNRDHDFSYVGYSSGHRTNDDRRHRGGMERTPQMRQVRPGRFTSENKGNPQFQPERAPDATQRRITDEIVQRRMRHGPPHTAPMNNSRTNYDDLELMRQQMGGDAFYQPAFHGAAADAFQERGLPEAEFHRAVAEWLQQYPGPVRGATVRRDMLPEWARGKIPINQGHPHSPQVFTALNPDAEYGHPDFDPTSFVGHEVGQWPDRDAMLQALLHAYGSGPGPIPPNVVHEAMSLGHENGMGAAREFLDNWRGANYLSRYGATTDDVWPYDWPPYQEQEGPEEVGQSLSSQYAYYYEDDQSDEEQYSPEDLARMRHQQGTPQRELERRRAEQEANQRALQERQRNRQMPPGHQYAWDHHQTPYLGGPGAFAVGGAGLGSLAGGVAGFALGGPTGAAIGAGLGGAGGYLAGDSMAQDTWGKLKEAPGMIKDWTSSLSGAGKALGSLGGGAGGSSFGKTDHPFGHESTAASRYEGYFEPANDPDIMWRHAAEMYGLNPEDIRHLHGMGVHPQDTEGIGRYLDQVDYANYCYTAFG